MCMCNIIPPEPAARACLSASLLLSSSLSLSPLSLPLSLSHSISLSLSRRRDVTGVSSTATCRLEQHARVASQRRRRAASEFVLRPIHKPRIWLTQTEGF